MSQSGKKVRGPAIFVLGGALLLSLTSCARIFDSAERLSTDEVEARIFKIVNDHRQSIGRKALVWNDAMADAERTHSQAMANGQVPFGHQGFDGRVTHIMEIIPWSYVGENVASAASAEDALAAWLRSAAHQDILEGDFDLTGVGVAKDPDGPLYYFSQMFLKPL